MIHQLLGNCPVSDLNRAQEWYTRLFGRGPDVRPMAGLIEWHLSDTFGLQLWADPDRAGCSSVVLGETALDAAAERLTDVGLHHAGPEAGGGARILQLNDPDGNHIVLLGS
ncbi:MAG: VOC family protein [Nesterenkonia sp.]